jgi:hypothetical protein
MIFGNFNDDLNQYLLENKGLFGASKASSIALLTRGEESKGPLDLGKMYAFRYFTSQEFFYDTFPIVIGLGAINETNQLGINLHYVPYRIRVSLINDITKSFSDFFESQIQLAGNPNVQRFNRNFTYDVVMKTLGKKYNLSYAIRQYRLDRMRKPRIIGYEDWYIGVVNDDNFFFGGTIREAQALYYKNI